MRIGIDVRYLSHGLMGGVHTYVSHFVPALIDLTTEHQVYLYADTKRPLELDTLPPHVTVRYLAWHSPLSSAYLDLFMRRQMARDRLDVVHFPANYGFGPPGTRTVITLHDALNILPLRHLLTSGGHVKTLRNTAMTVYLHLCTKAALRGATLLMTDSAHAGREIAARSGFDAQKIVPVHHAPPPGVRRITNESVLAAVRRRFELPPSFVLADALKNPAVLVRAWRLLPPDMRAGRQIVFFARHPNPLPIVHEAVAEGEARLLIRPSREDLFALYSMADAFVFPSWIEGFGLPVLEAMTCGAPLIASDRGSIPEVAGDAALICDAEDEVTFARYIEAVLGSPDVAADLRQRGFARAARFSWHKTAGQILQAYQTAAAA
jgi:glycosyltransferase involved in cell wall biosynthesis